MTKYNFIVYLYDTVSYRMFLEVDRCERCVRRGFSEIFTGTGRTCDGTKEGNKGS